MISDDDSLQTLSKKWKGPSYWSPALGRRGGVAILCSPRQREHISVWQKDAGGRLVSLLKFDNCKINLVNIYAPTNPTERGNFFPISCTLFFPKFTINLSRRLQLL